MRFPKNLDKANAIQHELKQKVKIIPLMKGPRLIAGVDASFTRDEVIGTACLYSLPEMAVIEETYATAKISFPYIPGFLSFREGPAIIKAIRRLKTKPDLILFDGQGIAHPKGMGIASHVGVLLNIPSIGCAKSRLVGDYAEPGRSKGEFSKLTLKNHTVGAVLRTRDRVRPLFVSPGHLINLEGAILVVIQCVRKYRIPEPLRRADALSKELRKKCPG